MKLLVCGDRNWTRRDVIKWALAQLQPDDVVIHGACRGADLMAAACAQSMGIETRAYPAKWDELGRRAGPIRNQQMLSENPDIGLAFAFHDDMENSRGTADMVRRLRKAGIPVSVMTSREYEARRGG
jgi:hypothetical protein